MTTTSLPPRHANSRPPSRLAWVAGLIWLGLFLLTHPSAPVPTGLLNVRVPHAPRDIEVGRLEEFAYGYRTSAEKRNGYWVAERWFGPLLVESHLNDNDYTTVLLATMAERERTAV